MTLYIIGLGLNGPEDITVKGLELVKSCDEVYLERYTSLLQCSFHDLAKFYDREITLADRNTSEQGMEKIVAQAKTENVAFLVIGDPFSATTHTALFKIAKDEGVKVDVIHNASILTAIGQTGLQLYKFGKTASIPFWTENHKPESFFDLLEQNQSIGAHTLFLLDLDPKENKFLSIKEALKIIQEISKKRNFKLGKAIGCSRLGLESEVIKYDSIKNLQNQDFGNAPYCIIIPGELNFSEEDFIANY